jgi:hypothetical protein
MEQLAQPGSKPESFPGNSCVSVGKREVTANSHFLFFGWMSSPGPPTVPVSPTRPGAGQGTPRVPDLGFGRGHVEEGVWRRDLAATRACISNLLGLVQRDAVLGPDGTTSPLARHSSKVCSRQHRGWGASFNFNVQPSIVMRTRPCGDGCVRACRGAGDADDAVAIPSETQT